MNDVALDKIDSSEIAHMRVYPRSFLVINTLMQLLIYLKKNRIRFTRKITWDYAPKSSLILLQLCLVLRQFLKCR